MKAAELQEKVLAHAEKYPGRFLSAHEWARVLGLEPTQAFWVGRHLAQLEDDGELASRTGPRDECDKRPCTRWGRTAGANGGEA